MIRVLALPGAPFAIARGAAWVERRRALVVVGENNNPDDENDATQKTLRAGLWHLGAASDDAPRLVAADAPDGDDAWLLGEDEFGEEASLGGSDSCDLETMDDIHAALGLCAPGGRWRDALQLMRQMQAACRPHALAYTSACFAWVSGWVVRRLIA